MNFYCIIYEKKSEDYITEGRYFLHEATKAKAIKRFCDMSGYKRTSIISVNQMGE